MEYCCNLHCSPLFKDDDHVDGVVCIKHELLKVLTEEALKMQTSSIRVLSDIKTCQHPFWDNLQRDSQCKTFERRWTYLKNSLNTMLSELGAACIEDDYTSQEPCHVTQERENLKSSVNRIQEVVDKCPEWEEKLSVFLYQWCWMELSLKCYIKPKRFKDLFRRADSVSSNSRDIMADPVYFKHNIYWIAPTNLRSFMEQYIFPNFDVNMLMELSVLIKLSCKRFAFMLAEPGFFKIIEQKSGFFVGPDIEFLSAYMKDNNIITDDPMSYLWTKNEVMDLMFHGYSSTVCIVINSACIFIEKNLDYVNPDEDKPIGYIGVDILNPMDLLKNT
ncbi:hypothetical protein JTE90_007003 [Oedothorax gibbosus]|uniref:Uncharacterized protein n=1 Tax=Oedothorax gibbosus TaxID=931172 RepID=A0AAV6TWG3_9ARAC|nr:hypothetical protein JTE90_007003 [Oedothorax gibbosus]